MAGGQHHAFAHAKLHFARGQVGHQHGELAHQLFRLVHAGDAAEDVAGCALARVQGQLQQLGGAFHRLAFDDFGDAQVHLGEVVNGDGGGNGFAAGPPQGGASPLGGQRGRGSAERGGLIVFAAGLGRFDDRRGGRLEQGFKLLHGDALHQVLVLADFVASAQERLRVGKLQGRHLQEGFDLFGHGGQHGL